MQAVSFRVALLILTVFSLPGFVHAQTKNGLRCHKVKDAFSAISGQMSVLQANAPFPWHGCRFVNARSKMVCVPSNNNPSSLFNRNGDSNMPLGNVAGDALTHVQICYKVKCDKYDPPIDPQQLEDDLGSRVFEGFRLSILCLPALNHTTPNPTTTTSTTTSTLP